MEIEGYLIGASIYTCLGLVTETIFTSIWNFFSDHQKNNIWLFHGTVSLLMIPVYFTGYYFLSAPLSPFLSKSNIYLTCVIITLMIYTVEFSWASIYDLFNIRPWNYDHSTTLFGVYIRFDIQGKITMLYLPFCSYYSYPER